MQYFLQGYFELVNGKQFLLPYLDGIFSSQSDILYLPISFLLSNSRGPANETGLCEWDSRLLNKTNNNARGATNDLFSLLVALRNYNRVIVLLYSITVLSYLYHLYLKRRGISLLVNPYQPRRPSIHSSFSNPPSKKQSGLRFMYNLLSLAVLLRSKV